MNEDRPGPRDAGPPMVSGNRPAPHFELLAPASRILSTGVCLFLSLALIAQEEAETVPETEAITASSTSAVNPTQADGAESAPILQMGGEDNDPRGRGGSTSTIRLPRSCTIAELNTGEHVGERVLLTGKLLKEDRDPAGTGSRLLLGDGSNQIEIDLLLDLAFPREADQQELFDALSVQVIATAKVNPATNENAPGPNVYLSDVQSIVPLQIPDALPQLADYDLLFLAAAFVLLLAASLYLWRQRRAAELHATELQTATENLRRSQEALRQSEERFRRAFEEGPVGVILASPNSHVLRANQTLCHLLGYSENELLGLGMMDLAHEEDTQTLCKHARLLFTGDINRYHLELRFHRKNKEVIWVKITASLLTNPEGEPLYALSIVEDITERKAWEQSLRQSEERFSKAFHASPVAISLASLIEGRFIDVNESFLQLVAGRREDLIGKTALDLGIWVSPEDRKDFVDQLLRQNGSLHNIEGQVRTMTGEVRACLGGAELIELNGEQCILTLITDFTEYKRAVEALRRSEERFQLIARATNDTVWDWDLTTNQVWWNEGIKTVFGYTAAQTPSDADWWDNQIHPEDRKRVVRSMQNIIDSKGHFWSAEYRFQRAESAYADVLDRAYITHDDNGQPTRMIGAIMDISDRKEFEKTLAQARDEALHSARLKSEFLANISHEVRTPLNGIVGMTLLLQDTSLDSSQESFVDTIKSSSEALLTIINDILDFSKMEAGKLNLEILDFDLRNTVENTIELLADQAENKHIELVSLINADVPTRLRGDPGRLRQVIINLVANAIKFTSEGEVVLTVSLEHSDDTHATLLFGVRDTGIGMPPDFIPQLFKAFSQADGSTTRRYGGTGLGLAISKQIVEMMGGQIGAKSQLAQGSTFWFTVGLAKQRPADTSGFGKPTALEGLSVLIADDNKASRQLLTEYTDRLGMRPSQVSSGKKALECLRKGVREGQAFTLAIVDHQMSDVDGMNLIRQIKADKSIAQTNILLMSSRAFRNDTDVLRDAGVGAFLTKPVRLQHLIDRLLSLVSPSPRHETRFWLDRKDRRAKTITADQTGDLDNLRILIAEDNPINQKVAIALLGKLGYRAQAVASGPEVLEAIKRVDYDLIFMDCQLPEIDGFQTTAEIRRLESLAEPGSKRTYVIAMTALVQRGAKDKCLSAGMDDYLSKPVRLDSLIAVIKRATEAPAEQAQDLTPPSEEILQSLDRGVMDTLKTLRKPGKPDPVIELIDMFLENTPEHIQRLERAAHRYDAERLSRESHSLRGCANSIGALNLGKICGELEDKADARAVQEATYLLNKLKDEFARVVVALEYEKSVNQNRVAEETAPEAQETTAE